MSEYDDLNLPRRALPDSRALQASIIAKTETMPQYIEAQQSTAHDVNNWRRHFKILAPVTMCGLIALALLIEPNENNQQALNPVASEQLDWREIMLAEDAWLLAEL